MKRRTVDDALRGAKGVSRGVKQWPDPLTLEYLAKACEEQERILRMQYPEDRLPVEWEAGLKHPQRQLTSMQGGISRFAYLTHLYRVRSEKLAAKDGDAEEVIGRMLRRDPIRVELAGRTVNVTGRSMNAMAEIAAHSLTVQELQAHLERAAGLEEKASGKRLARITRIERRIVMEIRLHRQAIYAHAFTDSGASADSLSDCPAWFPEVTAEDDSRLLSAMFAAVHGRIGDLHDALPEPDAEPKDRRRVDFGWHSLLMTLAPKMKVHPAKMYDEDLPRAVAFAHASTPQWEDLS